MKQCFLLALEFSVSMLAGWACAQTAPAATLLVLSKQDHTLSIVDPARNRESARRLAALEPALACFGHGAPLRDPGKLGDFVARLATDAR